MERVCVFNCFLLLCFTSFSLASDSSLIKAVPQRAAGVFLLIDGGAYTFNVTAARAACLFLNVTIATGTQMERALQHGLETCKFGWTAEQVAVVPRLTADKNCGQGKTGVVKWFAKPDQKFGVFCFNASDFTETSNASTASIPSSTSHSATLTALSLNSTSPGPRLRSSTPPSPPFGKPKTTTALEKISSVSTFTLLFRSTHQTLLPSTTPKAFSTHMPSSVPQLITSRPAVTSFTFSTTVQYSLSASSGPAILPSGSPSNPALGDVPTALIILGIVLLLLTATGVVWYYKLNIFRFWPQGQHKDDIETEMWKHTGSEMDLHSIQEEEEEEDRKYSSDITLCVKPDFKANSGE